MKKIFTLLALLMAGVGFSQTIDIGPDEYAFRYTQNNNFGLFFNATSTQYEFRDASALPIFAFKANSGRLTTNLEFDPTADYLVPNNRYAFRAKSDTDFGLYFNGSNQSYDFRNNLGNAIFSIAANSGNLVTSGYILPGNTISGVEGSIRFDGSDLQGRVGGQWVSLTAAASGGSDLQEAYEANNVIIADQGSVEIEGTDGLQVSGQFGSGIEPVYGASDATRMYFSPNKGAFRAGYVTNGSWDPGITGAHSAAFGFNTIALGESSFAAGDSTRATGTGSVAIGKGAEASLWAAAFGRNTDADGPGSMVMGNNTSTEPFAQYSFAGGENSTATASFSMSFGFGNMASALASTAFGYQSAATGQRSFAAGLNTAATGNSSIALGENIESNGTASFAAGSGVISAGFASVAMGDGTESTGEASFAAGTGSTASGDASAAFGEGNQATQPHTFAAGEDNLASGTGAVVFGRNSESSGNFSFASGNGATASGSSAVSMGSNSEATGGVSVAFGFSTDSEGFGSIATGAGSRAAADYSVAMGQGTDADGPASVAMGSNTRAASAYETAIGRFNTEYTPSDPAGFDENDRLFVVGNGTGTSDRSDALVVLKNGNMGLGTSTPGTKLTVAGVSPGTAGIRLVGGSNYLATDSWEMGQALNEPSPVVNGDFVIKRQGTARYNFWSSYFAPTVDGGSALGLFSQRWSEVYALNGTINTSDEREKKNIRDTDYGLEEVLKMRPVTYEWKDYPHVGTKVGFIAQDLLEVVPEVVVTQKRVEDRETGAVTYEEAERYGVYYDDLIPVLAKAIQEQQVIIEEVAQENEELVDENQSLRSELDELKDRMNRFEQDLQSCCFSSESSQVSGANDTDKAELGQNIPNPFSQSTIIQYYLPEGTVSAIIRVTDMEGSPVEDIQLGAQVGANQVEFRTQSLAAGTYLYSLFVDGKFVSTKKMMIAR